MKTTGPTFPSPTEVAANGKTKPTRKRQRMRTGAAFVESGERNYFVNAANSLNDLLRTISKPEECVERTFENTRIFSSVCSCT